MSLLFDVVKKVKGKPTDKVNPLVRNGRLAICNACPHLNDKTRSCGGLFTGGTVEHNGEKMELCGCRIDDKTWYKYDGCPLGKW